MKNEGLTQKTQMPEFRNKKILITGGAGMIGSHLTARLLGEGALVTVIDDLSSGRKEFLPTDPNLHFIQGDINDPEALDRAFESRPDIVFHMAALFANQNSVEHPEKDLRINGLGTLQVLEKAHATRVKKMIYASSSCVYPTNLEELDEDAPDSSTSTPYAISKFVGERYCKYYNKYFGLPVVIVRYFNCYGPHEYPGEYRNVIPNFIAKALAGESLKVHGDGSDTRDFTYVEDAVECTCLAATQEEAVGHTFNIGTGNEINVLELAAKINKIIGNNAGVEHVPIRRWDKVRKRYAKIDKIKSILGFNPKHELDTGLLKTYDWFKTI